ncbi:MAG: FAD:protein FMN transferase [Calditrichaeota bacterium]|nr:MAG: FAD:protein FMN transferase [Calditrichota bacterium]
MSKKIIKFGLILILFILAACVKNEPAFIELKFDGSTMGTSYMVKIVTPAGSDPKKFQTDLQKNVDDILYKLDKLQMSTYSKNSELSQFNLSKKLDWFPVSAELATVFDKSDEIYQRTAGAFDITVGPLVNLWGFGPELQSAKIPTENAIKARKRLVGQQNIAVRLHPPAIKKTKADVYCDLSAIAKGFAVDEVAAYLANAGFKNYLVEIGGEIRASGRKANGDVWRIGVATPVSRGGIQKVVRVADTGMATSGDYLNYFEKNGVRYSHTIDPVTGKPITHKLASVTIIHPSCMIADGYATAINVMGPEKGYEFALERNLPVLMIVRSDDGFIEKMTPQFEKIFTQK